MCSDNMMLNAAVRAYLVSQGYKLTALTLSEEGGSSIPATLPQSGASLLELFQGNAQKVAAAEARQANNSFILILYVLTLLTHVTVSSPGNFASWPFAVSCGQHWTPPC